MLMYVTIVQAGSDYDDSDDDGSDEDDGDHDEEGGEGEKKASKKAKSKDKDRDKDRDKDKKARKTSSRRAGEAVTGVRAEMQQLKAQLPGDGEDEQQVRIYGL